MIKRRIPNCFLIVLVAAFLLTGYGVLEKAEGETAAKKLQDKGMPDRIVLIGGSVGGDWAALAEGLGQVYRRAFSKATVIVEPGKDGPNAVLADKGGEDLLLSQSLTTTLAYEGNEPYKTKLSKIRTVAMVRKNQNFSFLMIKKTGLKGLDDIKTKKYPLRVSVNKRGSSMEILARTVFGAYGITYTDIEKWGGKVHFQSFGPSFELMDDGKLDVVIGNPPYPAAHFVQASTKHDLTLLPLTDEAIKEIAEKLDMIPAIIPKEAYTFLDKDVPTVGTTLLLITNIDKSEEQIYQLTRVLYESVGYLRNVHATMREMNTAELPLVGRIPLHPGAAKFYREKDLLK